ncbi:MAG: ABC transporter ATP-binding protein [Bdellovibrionales bacterium]|nr:ABC transporter ATP-binding protein [Bdellovibrionales bacterium]
MSTTNGGSQNPWQIFRRFWPEVAPHKGLLCGGAATLFLEVALRIIEPWPLKYLVDSVLTPSLEGNYRGTHAPLTSIATLSLLYCVVISLRAVAAYFNTLCFAHLGQRVVKRVRSRLFSHMQKLSLSYYASARHGDLVIRMIGDVGLFQDVMVTAALPLAGNIVVIGGMFLVMLLLHWKLGLISICLLPALYYMTVRLSRRIHTAARRQRKLESSMAASVSEAFASVATVKALALEQTFGSLFSQGNEKSLKEGVTVQRASAKLERSVDFLIGIESAAVLFLGGWFVLEGELTIGGLLVFLAYLKNAFKPMRNYSKYCARLSKAAAAGERIIEILDAVPEVEDAPDAVVAPPLQGAIEFRDVSFGYESGQQILSKVSFHAPAGCHTVLLAPSGTGKSTLLSLLLRFYQPDGGDIRVDGLSIAKLRIDSLREQIAVVLQNTELFAGSIRDNILGGLTDVSEERLHDAIVTSQLAGFISSLSDGLDTLVGERGVTLSKGQRQRIAIARAVVRQRPILLLDEPMSGLDPESQKLVSDAIRMLAGRATILHVTHDLRHAASADHIVVLDEKRVIEAGSHLELMALNSRYAGLYAIQQAGFGECRQ